MNEDERRRKEEQQQMTSWKIDVLVSKPNLNNETKHTHPVNGFLLTSE